MILILDVQLKCKATILREHGRYNIKWWDLKGNLIEKFNNKLIREQIV